MGAYLLIQLALAFPAAPAQDNPGEPKSAALRPDPEWKPLGRSLWFDPKARRVIVRARVCLREGYLEHLLCSKGTKEHEAILASDAIGHEIHAALLATGIQPGHPVQFVPKFEPPAGPAIAIELRWHQDGKPRTADAREWVRDDKAKAPLALDWVFAGSQFAEDPETKKQVYVADYGDLFTVANFGSAILDLPIASSADDADRAFTTNTDKIPPLGTEVFMVLSPRRAQTNPKPAAGTNRGR
jgi:hypothetical protein